MSVSNVSLTQLYIAYFNRAPDPAGLGFWENAVSQGFEIGPAADAFATAPETLAIYSFLSNPNPANSADFINSIYQNLFNRDAEPEGLAFWVSVLEGGFPPGRMILSIIEGATGPDVSILENKASIASHWVDLAKSEPTFSLSTAAIQASRVALDAATAEEASVTAGAAISDQFFGYSNTRVLSADTDLSEVPDLSMTDTFVLKDGATLTLNLEQVQSLIADNPAWIKVVDGTAGATLDITGLEGGDVELDLDALIAQVPGLNIGTLFVGGSGVDLSLDTTLGQADQIVLDVSDQDVTIELSAAQYNGLADGTIIESRDVNSGSGPVGTVLIDYVVDIEDSTLISATIDVRKVDTTGSNQFFVRDAFNQSLSNTNGPDTDVAAISDDAGDHDATFSPASELGDFAVTLIDLNSTSIDDEVVGQTVRFSNEVQAARGVNVLGADPDAEINANDPSNAAVNEEEKNEKDSNVLWLFETITGGIDVSGYSGQLGRVWFSDVLLANQNGNVDGLFTIPDPNNPDVDLYTLNENIFRRIQMDGFPDTTPVREPGLAVTSYTAIAGAEFEIDDFLVSATDLIISFGGATSINNLEIDNLLGPVASNPLGSDPFGTLTLNSFIANTFEHFLLPDAFVPFDIPLPSDDVQIVDQSNNIGDISSGEGRDVLRDIVINLGVADPSPGVNVPNGDLPDDAPDGEGIDLNIQTVFFSDHGDEAATGDSEATLEIKGANDVTFKSLDTSDVDIAALTISTIDHTGILTVTGGSAAFDGDGNEAGQGDTTETLIITNGGAALGVIQLASTIQFADTGLPKVDIDYAIGSGEAAPFSGVSSGALSSIDTTGHGGMISLGTISQVSGDAFLLTTGTNGQVFARLGAGLDDGVLETPELSATGAWTMLGGAPGQNTPPGRVANLDLELQAVTFNSGGKLTIGFVDLTITGDVDLSPLDPTDLTISGPMSMRVDAGGSLTLSVEQAVAFAADDLTITGEGTLIIEGIADDAEFGALFGTGSVDLSGLAITDIDADGAVAYELQGAKNKIGEDILQVVTGADTGDITTVFPTTDQDRALVVFADFAAQEDKIDFDTLLPGDALNYQENSEVADYETAFLAAEAFLAGGGTYYLTSTAADGGLLFYDASADGSVDGFVSLQGIDATIFDPTLIV